MFGVNIYAKIFYICRIFDKLYPLSKKSNFKIITLEDYKMDALRAIKISSVGNVNASEVMKAAWDLAKMIGAEYGVSAKSLLSAALKKVWAHVKVTVCLFNAYESRRALATMGFKFNEETKAWVKEMALGEFKAPQAFKFGGGTLKGMLTVSQVERAFSYTHKIIF